MATAVGASNNRDEFSNQVKQVLCARVGGRCSNPACGAATMGPNSDAVRAINLGVAAHIHAAARGGPRYEHFMSADQRSDVSNGIWLCHSCASLIDKDPAKYTVDILKQWKAQAEHKAITALEAPAGAGSAPSASAAGSPAAAAARHDEKFALRRVDDRYIASATDITNAAARMARALHDQRPVSVTCNYPEFARIRPVDDGSVADAYDSIELAAYKREKDKKGERIARAIEQGFSTACYTLWGIYLQNVADWTLLLLGIPDAFTDDRVSGTVEKIELWRTDPPRVQASFRLTQAEANAILAMTGERNLQFLACGAGAQAADQLPRELILKKVLPNILRGLVDAGIDIRHPDKVAIVNLPDWHISTD